MAQNVSSERETDDQKKELPDEQKRELLKICGEWIDFGHEIKSEAFVGGLADALLQRDSEKEGNGARFMRHRYPTWENGFLKEVSSLKGKLTEARKVAKGEKDKLARQWLSNLRSLIHEYTIEKEDIYAVRDLTFVTLRSKGRKPGIISRPTGPNKERRPVASAIHCFSAKGVILAPWAIVKEETDTSYENSARVKVIANQNGFASCFDFMRWLTDHFDPQTRSSLKNDQWRLILVDSYKSLVTEKFFFWCREHRILCLSLPKNKKVKLDPFYWSVQDRLQGEYKNSLELRWKELLKQTPQRGSSDKNCGIILKPQEFADILGQMTIMGESCEIAERKAEAENAWRCVLSASMGVQISESEDTEPWNNEDMDEVFATIGERDIDSQGLVTPKSSSGGKVQPTSASPGDSDDEYIPPEEVHLDTDFSSKRCGDSHVADTSSTESLVSRSKFTPMSMASENVAASPGPLDRRDSDGTKICIAQCSASLSRSSVKLPSSHNEGCSFSAKSSPHPEVPGGMGSLSDSNESPTLSRSWSAQKASPACPGDLDQPLSPKTPNKRMLKDIEDEYKRDKKRAKHMSPEEKKSSMKAARRKRSAAIASLL